MTFEKLTLRSVDLRPVLVPLERPVVSRVGLLPSERGGVADRYGVCAEMSPAISC